MDRRAYSQENRNQRADSAAKTVVISPKAEAETPNPTGIKGLFEGLSVSQVTAGALAAVTSMLLSAQIGIAGSVIGVAVGSVVSTVSSQLYKKFLAGSAEKLRGFASSDNAEGNATTNAAAAQSATQSFAHAQTTIMPITRAPFEGAETTTLPSVGTATRAFNEAAVPSTNSAETSVLSAGQIVGADAHDMRGNQAAQGTQSNTPRINSAAGHTGNASHATGVVEIEAQKQKTMQRRVLAVSVASSLAAILLFAGLVLMFTGGEGIGTKVAPFTGEVVTSQLADENSAATSNDTEKTHDAKKAETTQNENEKNSAPQSPQQNSTQSASNSSSTTESGTNSSNTNSGSENSSSASGNNNPSSSGSGSGQTSSDNTNSNSNNANSSGSGSTDSGGNATNSGSTGSESSASSQAGSGK